MSPVYYLTYSSPNYLSTSIYYPQYIQQVRVYVLQLNFISKFWFAATEQCSARNQFGTSAKLISEIIVEHIRIWNTVSTSNREIIKWRITNNTNPRMDCSSREFDSKSHLKRNKKQYTRMYKILINSWKYCFVLVVSTYPRSSSILEETVSNKATWLQ